jgi:hypothetical protein
MAYNAGNPPLKDLQNLEWAVFMFRFASGIKGSDSQMNDEEIKILLELNKGSINGFDYYRPYESVAFYVATTKSEYKTVSIGQTSYSKVDIDKVSELRRQQTVLDYEAKVLFGGSDTPSKVTPVRVFWETP